METSLLTAEETRAVEILYRDWQDLCRCTSIDQALGRAGVPFSHSHRLHIAEFLRDDAKADPLMRWEPAVYVLTNEEKLLARRILRLWQEQSSVPQPSETDQKTFAQDAERVAFETLAWLGFLRKTNHGYELAPNHARFLGGLGFYFHEVVLPERNERFNTNCAPDFFIMTHPPTRERLLERVAAGSQPVATAGEGMSQKMVDAVRGATTPGARSLSQSASYGDERAILNDACGWSDEPIGVVMDHGKLVDLTPVSTWYLLGGGCGVNNLFRSEEALQSWLREHPQFRDREAGPLEAFLSQTS